MQNVLAFLYSIFLHVQFPIIRLIITPNIKKQDLELSSTKYYYLSNIPILYMNEPQYTSNLNAAALCLPFV